MTTKAIQKPKKRKLIDISEDALQTLSVKAALKGKSLKAYIESLIEAEAKLSIEEAYAFLLENYPPEPASEEEEAAFRKKMGI